jgi:hypothetical protein
VVESWAEPKTGNTCKLDFLIDPCARPLKHNQVIGAGDRRLATPVAVGAAGDLQDTGQPARVPGPEESLLPERLHRSGVHANVLAVRPGIGEGLNPLA